MGTKCTRRSAENASASSAGRELAEHTAETVATDGQATRLSRQIRMLCNVRNTSVDSMGAARRVLPGWYGVPGL